MVRPCVNQGCDKDVSDRSQFDECPNCRAGWRYWMKRPVGHVVDRRRKLGIYTQRVDKVINSRHIKRK